MVGDKYDIYLKNDKRNIERDESKVKADENEEDQVTIGIVNLYLRQNKNSRTNKFV